MYFTINRSTTGQYFVRLVGDNHEVLAHSEQYRAKASAENAVRVIKGQAGNGRVIDNS